MSGVETRSRLDQLYSLARRTQHELDSAARRGDREEYRRLLVLQERVDEEIVAAGGKRLSKGPGKPRKPGEKAQARDLKLLQQLGVTAHDVKVWAVGVGLLDQVRRGRIRSEIVKAYAAARARGEVAA